MLRKLWKTTPFRIATVVAVLFAIGVGYYFISVPVETGTKVLCRYGHVISDNTYTLRVPKFLADRFKVTEKKSVCSKHARAERLYAQAQGKIANKDYAEAKKILKEIAKIDPNFKQTKSQLSAIGEATSSGSTSGGSSSSGSSSSGDTGGSSPGGSSSGGTSGDGSPYVQPDLVGLLPQGDIPGYNRGAIVFDNDDASVDYLPEETTAARIGSLLITVRKYGNSDGPKSFINKTSKVVYPNNQKSPKVKGHEGYFGTSDFGLATLSWPDGVLVYEILMRSADFKPAGLYEDIVKIVDYFP